MKNFQFKMNIKNTTQTLLLCICLFILEGNSLNAQIICGAEQINRYHHIIKNKKIAVVANQTSVIGSSHLVDTLMALKYQIVKIFAAEHGFRGNVENGGKIKNEKDAKTGLPIISLYGKHIKPTKLDLTGIDVVVFDIQDVGVRYYTFLTTMHYVMEACAEYGKKFIVLDRPNPNGHYIDGPVLDTAFRSMVGIHPIPLVHGMTLGELALMIKGENWLKTTKKIDLMVITVSNYTHNTAYDLPIAPSPNLPTTPSIILYPTLGLLEGTILSMGRGTDKPFECFGAPWLKIGSYEFTPKNIVGKANNPPYLNEKCRGLLLTDFANDYIVSYNKLYIEWLVLLYKECPDKKTFFNPFFTLLAGNKFLQKQIEEGKNANEIRLSWQVDLQKFSKQREPYLLYEYSPNKGLIKNKKS